MNSLIYAVAMSGGVDSSATATILKNAGYEIFGITMNIHEYCSSAIENAEKVCEKLGIQHFVFDCKVEFRKNIMDVFANYYANGLTPNPCALCNRDIKMNLLLKFAIEKGANLMATGHYVKMSIDDEFVKLQEAKNQNKDQSYFLSLVNKENFKNIRFPLGNFSDKLETRKMAASFGLHNFEQKDSQDICFIQNGNYKSFLKDFYSNLNLFSSGDIKLNGTNRALAKHNGIANYTIGQRRGLAIAFNDPLYVTELNSNENEVIVGTKKDLVRMQFSLFEINWLVDVDDSFIAFVKLRSFSKKTKAEITKNEENKVIINLLDIPTTPVTPGQVCAIYDEANIVLGAGVIGK